MSRQGFSHRLDVILVLALVLGLLLLGPGSALAEEGGHGVSSAKAWDLIWRIINFVVMFVILIFVLKKPISRFFSNRRETIAQTLADLEAKKAEAEERFKKIEDKLSELDVEREKIIAEYIKGGQEEKEKIIANAHEMADRIKQQAEVTIQQELKAAKDGLMREIADMSASMAEDMIRKNINEDDQRRLVEEYITKVVER